MAVRSCGLLAFLWQRNLSAFSSTTNRVVGSRLGLQCFSSSKRSYAGESSGGEDNTVDGDNNAGAADRHNNGPNSRIEQALNEIRIQSAAPDWLPFFPGGSFWIHPDQIAAKKPEKPSGPLVYVATDREVLAMVMPMGWPTSTATGDAMKPEEDSSK